MQPFSIRNKVNTATTQYIHNGVTYTFSGAVEVSTFRDGSPCVPPGTVISSVSPAWGGSGMRHGAMLNPTPGSTQGYDSRMPGVTYDGDDTAAYPLELSAGDRLVATVSYDPDSATVPTGGSSSALFHVSVLTCLTTAPSAATFRPAYCGTGESVYTTDDVNLALLPDLTNPAGTTIPSLDAWEGTGSAYAFVNTTGGFAALDKTLLDHGPESWGSKMYPSLAYWPYPATQAQKTNLVALKALVDHAEQLEAAYRLIQIGIDLDAISATNGNAWSQDGGFGWGRKWPILFKRIMFEESESTVPYYVTGSSGELKFQEDAFTYAGTDGMTTVYRWGKDNTLPDASYSGSNHTTRSSTGEYDQYYLAIVGGEEGATVGTYECITARTMVGSTLAARLMSSNWVTQHAPVFGYADRYVDSLCGEMESNGFLSIGGNAFKDDVIRFGGSGNGWVKAMWETYR